MNFDYTLKGLGKPLGLSFGLVLMLTLSPPIAAQRNTKGLAAKQHFDRAVELQILNDPRAEQEYRLAIKARRGHYPEALERLALLLRGELRFSEAAALFKEYISQTPLEDHSEYLKEVSDLNRASILELTIRVGAKQRLEDFLEFCNFLVGYGNIESAELYAQKAVSLYPDSARAHLLLARFLPDQTDRQHSELEIAVKLDPGDPEVHCQLGWYYFSAGRDIRQAIREFRQSLQLSDSRYADAWQGLGHSLVLDGQPKEAIGAFESYLRTRKTPSQYDDVIRRKIEMLKEQS